MERKSPKFKLRQRVKAGKHIGIVVARVPYEGSYQYKVEVGKDVTVGKKVKVKPIYSYYKEYGLKKAKSK